MDQILYALKFKEKIRVAVEDCQQKISRGGWDVVSLEDCS